jgi:hypothetical protein
MPFGAFARTVQMNRRSQGEGKTMKLIELAAIPAIALAASLGLAACGTTVIQPAPVKPAATTPAAGASAPQVIINNNPAPAPAPTVYVPVQAPAAPAVQSDPWSVVVAYTNDVNTPGGNSAAWNLLGPSVQAGWNSDYNTFVTWADPTSFQNVNEVSESGDTVTFTFDLKNGTYGTDVPYTGTFTVDNGIITSSTSSPSS